jgi:CRP-like cAMP-binding protein
VLDGAPSGGLAERLLALRRFDLLSGLPASDLALVARLARDRDLQPGDVLAVEGDPVHGVQLIVSGRATLARADARVQEVGALDTIGLLPLAAGIAHSWTAVAADAVHALEVDADLVADVLEDDFSLFAGVLKMGARYALAAARRPVALVSSTGAADRRGPIVKGSPHPSPAALDAAERLLYLRAIDPFGALPVDGLAALVKRLELVQLAPGAELRTQPASGDLLLLVTGRARIDHGSASDGGTNASGDGRRSGAALGLLEALADAPFALHLRALSPVQLLRGTIDDLFDVLQDHHRMARQLLAELLCTIGA